MNGNSGGRTWLWAGIAFVVGLSIGLGLFAWQYSTTQRTIASAKRRLESDNASLTAECQKLASQARTAEASAAALAARLEVLQPSTGGTAKTAPGTTVATGPVAITDRSVTPEQVGAGNKLTLTIMVRGKVDSARMRLVSSSYDKIWDLAQGATDGGVTTWERTISAPSPKGVYHYYAIAYAGKTKYTMPGTQGFTFTVK